jgi:hypothetical protein
MISYDQLREQTLLLRRQIARLLGDLQPHADTMPRGWRNHPWWHVGHLVTTPRLITLGLMGEDIGLPAGYRALFAKGSTPADWATASAEIPSYAHLLAEMLTATEELFDMLADRQDVPYPQPYATSTGVVLATPAEGLNFSLAHDGIHLGLLMAMARALA